MSLARVPYATPVEVVGIRGSGAATQRLMEMGLIEGASVQVVRRAPLGDPLQVRLGDYELSLRVADAEMIDVAGY
ncbi:Ferrous iron transport protein A [Phycisphaerae bacterium RAS1]|nr:Ferrous iron transport protein A [Phycisphaerae bacterium RAS1]